nr:hypothetical protein [Tanacetum cinerariifolium]
ELVETPLFEGMIVEQQVDEGDVEVNVDDVHFVVVAAEGVVSAANADVPTAIEEPSIPSPTLPTLPPQSSQDVPLTFQVYLTLPQSPQAKPQSPQPQQQPSQDAKISMNLLQTIIDTYDIVMDDISKQEGIITNIDADEDIVLEDAKDVAADAKDGQDANIDKMDVDTTDKIIIKVVTTASTTITAADVPIHAAIIAATPTLTASPSRRRKGVVIRDPQVTPPTSSTIIHSEAKSKDKGKGIL